MKRKRKFSTGEGVYEGDGYAGVENGMGGGVQEYGGEGEYGPDVSGGNTSKPGESIESQTASQRQDMSPANYAELQNSVGIELGKNIAEMLGGAGMLGKVGGVTGINAAIGNAIGMNLAKGTEYGTARGGDAGDPGENGDRRPGDTASDVKPFGSDAPTGTTKMEDEKGTGEKKYRWDPKLRQYVLENLGAGANPMGYRQGQVFQMAQGGLAAGARARRSFATGGTMAEAFLNRENTPGNVTPLTAQQKADVVAMAERNAAVSGKTREQELLKYGQDAGFSLADLDTWMGYPAGTSAWWASNGTTNTGTTNTGTTNTGTVDIGANMKLPDGYVDQNTTPLPYLPKDETVDTGDTGTVDTGDTGTVDTGGTKPPALDPFGGLEAFNPEDRAAVVAEARRLAGLSGRTPERELYNFATQKSGLGSGQIDRLMGYDPGTTDAWWAQQAGGGRDALANGGGGYGGGGSNFNNGGLDGLGVRNADGTRTMFGGVNDNAYDPRQHGWRTGLQAAAPAQQGRYIRGMAAGGIAAGAPAPRFVSGGGTGLSDEVPVTMDDGGAGRLADGEFVITADVVSGLGGGSSKAGAKMLYDMMERVRQQAHGSKKQIRPVDPKRVLPA